MYFCIRDDDTSFFTSPEELERAYGKVTQWGPVSLAVIPFCRAGFSKGVPEKFRGRWSTHPLHENRALVEYLRAGISEGGSKSCCMDIITTSRVDEANFRRGDDLAKKVIEGRKYLQDLLSTEIRVFVAPKNTVGKDGLRAIVQAGLHFGGTVGIRAGWPLFSR